MLPEANKVKRETVPASHLTIGLQCGGSDGYSGITANPALGAAVDLLVRHGGTAILSETPEIYGAEHMLTRRAVIARSRREAGRAASSWWEEYTARNGGEMNNNPSPGNKAGGLTTILEKSLGAVAKGGTTNLVDVYRVCAAGDRARASSSWTRRVTTRCRRPARSRAAPTSICFTTGRGSAYGCKPAPSLKLATNTPTVRAPGRGHGHQLRRHRRRHANRSQESGRKFFELILKTASGEKTKSEQWGYGDDEFAPWVVGATM